LAVLVGLAKADDVLVVEETDAVEMLRGLGVVVLSALGRVGVGWGGERKERKERGGEGRREVRKVTMRKQNHHSTEVTMRIQ